MTTGPLERGIGLARHPLRRHLAAVARMAVRLAPRAGVDPKRAEAAGLLHDWLKPWPRARLARVLGGGAARLGPPPVWHGPAAAALAPRALGILDRGVLAAVRWHTTGRARPGPLDRVLMVADFCSEDRTFREAAVARRLAARDLGLAARYVVAARLALHAAGGIRTLPAGRACWRSLWRTTPAGRARGR